MRIMIVLLTSLVSCAMVRAAEPAAPPNVIVIFADDLGYGDLGCYGAKEWQTPHLDGLAKAGVRFTDFHVSQAVCSASRASLLTGCYANRIGIHGALSPGSTHGLADGELTMAEMFRQKGYATSMVGKWHLGDHPMFLPIKHGFDSYYGLPYSNDMWPDHPLGKNLYPPLPLIENDKVVNKNVTAEDQAKLTRAYTDRAVTFIGDHKSKPFFLYVAHTMPHVPLFIGADHKGASRSGLYGDVIQEIDTSVGDILAAVARHGLEKNTLVIFTSDNGPWLNYGNHSGRTGGLREGKGTSWEGGVRVPCLARWPGQIPPGSLQTEPSMTIDLLPTFARLAGADLPRHPIDGRDIWPLFACEAGAKCPHEAYYHYYQNGALEAVRSGQWKLMLPHTYRSMAGQTPGKDGVPGKYKNVAIREPELYDLSVDVGETRNVANDNPDVMKRLLALADKARDDLGDTLTKKVGKGIREPGRLPK